MAIGDFYVEEEEVTFALADNMKAPASLAVWFSDYNTDATGSATVFEQQADVKVVGGKFSLKVPVGSHFTISTIRTATKGSAGDIPASSQSFPLSPSESAYPPEPPSAPLSEPSRPLSSPSSGGTSASSEDSHFAAKKI